MVLETLITYFLSSFILLWVFLVTQMVENPPAAQETWVQSLGCPWVGKIPWRRERLSTPIFLPGESYERRSLMGCSPRDRKELDTTERLSSPNLFLIFPPSYVILRRHLLWFPRLSTYKSHGLFPEPFLFHSSHVAYPGCSGFLVCVQSFFWEYQRSSWFFLPSIAHPHPYFQISCDVVVMQCHVYHSVLVR